MEDAPQKKFETRLRRQYDNSGNGPLSADLISAVNVVYGGIAEFHDTSIRLTREQFLAVTEDPRRFTKCVIFLLVCDKAEGKRVPIITEMWLLPEMGEGRGWIRVKLRLPSKPPPPKS